MDRQGGKEFHLTFQTAQSHDIVGSQISKREIISDQVADKISLSEIREYEGRSIFDKKDLEIEVDNGWPMFFATEAEKERRVQESQERRYCASLVSVSQLIQSCGPHPTVLTSSVSGMPKTLVILI